MSVFLTILWYIVTAILWGAGILIALMAIICGIVGVVYAMGQAWAFKRRRYWSAFTKTRTVLTVRDEKWGELVETNPSVVRGTYRYLVTEQNEMGDKVPKVLPEVTEWAKENLVGQWGVIEIYQGLTGLSKDLYTPGTTTVLSGTDKVVPTVTLWFDDPNDAFMFKMRWL